MNEDVRERENRMLTHATLSGEVADFHKLIAAARTLVHTCHVDMKAKKKKLDKVKPEELGVEIKPHLTITSVIEPPKRAAGITVGSIDELVDKMRNEAKVIA